MNEIEAKRKELEKNRHILFHDDYHDTKRIDGFNLGVEMARKEILDILKENLNLVENNRRKGKIYNRYQISENKLKKILKSLEEKNGKTI